MSVLQRTALLGRLTQNVRHTSVNTTQLQDVAFLRLTQTSWTQGRVNIEKKEEEAKKEEEEAKKEEE